MAKSGTADFYNGVAAQSLRFDRASDPFLNRTATLGNRKTWTFSTWLKRSGFTSAVQYIFGTNVSNNDATSANIHIGSDNTITVAPWANHFVKTAALLRDVGAWYHIVVDFDTTQAGSANADRVNIYINGVDQPLTNGGATLGLNTDWAINLNQANTRIGDLYGDANELDGYLAETNFVDGLSLDASYFGETKNGVWIPKEPVVSDYGTNGFRLKFNADGLNTSSGAVSSPTNIGDDSSGKNNHFSVSGIVASDCAMPDSPENNFATLNPLDVTSATLSEGNLKIVSPANIGANASYKMSTGKWYAEFYIDNSGSRTVDAHVIVGDIDFVANFGGVIGSFVAYRADGNINGTSGNATFTTGDIIAVAINADDGTVAWYKNNAVQSTTVSSLSYDAYCPSIVNFNGSGAFAVANFGQDGSFAGVLTGSAIGDEPDGNGYGLFKYSPPSGFLSLSSKNLPEPTIGANSDTQADDHFNTAIYTGNGGTINITVGFQPDFSWYKCRAGGDNRWHYLFDSNRGANKAVYSNLTGAEDSQFPTLNTQSFQPDGTRIVRSSGDHLNNNGDTYVSWNWKAGGSASTIAVDSVSSGVPSIASSVSANTTAGFSIVTYSGNADASATIGHGLQVNGVATTPKMIMVKKRDEAGNWIVFTETTGEDNKLNLNATTAIAESALFNNADPTSTVFSVKDTSSDDTFGDGHTYVAYCFADVEGYSKFGSYTGNANADGTFVYTGFRPAFIIVKSTASANWELFDTTRSPSNVIGIRLFPSLSNAENTGEANCIDIVSNGFKVRGAYTGVNQNATVHIYMAFGDSFKYANAR